MSEAFSESSSKSGRARDTRTQRCFGCGTAAQDPSQAADLATPWLLPAESGAVRMARFCRACAPTGEVGEIECLGCGDGPLLAGELADADLLTGAAIDSWLAATGWRPAGPWCPQCSSARHIPQPRRRHGA